MKNLFILVFLCFFSLLFTSCASSPKLKNEEVKMTVSDEEKMTQEALREMSKDYPRFDNVAVQNYIEQLGQKIVQQNNLDGNPYHYSFTVCDVNYVNAFALPGGTIFVTVPLLAMAESEAELAGVLGHEVGHVVQRHTAKRMQLMEQEKTKNMIYAAGAGVVGGVAGFGLGKLLCPPHDNICLAKVAAGGAIVGAGGTLLVQKYRYMANSREDELESDRVGFGFALRGGYSKEHIGGFYNKLAKMEQDTKKGQDFLSNALADAMSTHPSGGKRIEQMRRLSLDANNPSHPIIDTPTFDQVRSIAQNYLRGKKKD